MPARLAPFLWHYSLTFFGSGVAVVSGLWGAFDPLAAGSALTGLAGVILAVLPFAREWRLDRDAGRHERAAVRARSDEVLLLQAKVVEIEASNEWLRRVVEKHVKRLALVEDAASASGLFEAPPPEPEKGKRS